MKRMVNYFKNIPSEISISKREFFLTTAVCMLFGIVLGMLGSPRKTQIIGSNNGNSWGSENDESEDMFDEE